MQAVTQPQVEDSVLDVVYADMRRRGILLPTTPRFQAAMAALCGQLQEPGVGGIPGEERNPLGVRL